MMFWTTGVGILQQALLLGVWLALPLWVAISAAGILASYVLNLFGINEAGSLIAPKILVAGAILAIFGAWMLSLLGGFWVALWQSTAAIVRMP